MRSLNIGCGAQQVRKGTQNSKWKEETRYKVNAFGRTENGRYDPPSWKHKWIMMKITNCSHSGKIC